MRRFLKIWLILSLINSLARPLLDFAVFGRIDLTDVAIFQLLLVPAFQGALLWWLTLAPGTRLSWAELSDAPAVRWIVLMDIGMLGAGWAGNDPPSFPTEAWRIPSIYLGVKTLFAGILVLIQFFRRRAPEMPPALNFLWAAGLLLFACDCFIRQPTLLLNGWLAPLPEVIRGMIIYGGFVIAAVVLMLRIQRDWSRFSPQAARCLGGSLACLFAFAIGAQLNLFNRPQVFQPWLSLLKTLGFLSVSFACLAVWRRFHDSPGFRHADPPWVDVPAGDRDLAEP